MSTPRPTILVIDDDPLFLGLSRGLLGDLGYHAETAASAAEADARAAELDPSAILLDWRLGEQDGLELLPELGETFQSVPVILVTAEASTDLVVRAMRAGAFDFVEKPLDDARLLAALTKAVQRRDLLRRVASVERGDADSFEGMIGGSTAMQTVFRIIEQVAATDVSVLIQGESGTGKELVAGAVHRISGRRGGFVAVNMAAVPRDLVESTLFGYERGAFTGADRRRPGLCEQASGGTLFLDEITEMSVDLQSKLLRFLQERTFRRVGGSDEISADVRVVSATNRDLDAEIRDGAVREDLIYRLNTIPIHLPPLRDRAGDIPLLATRFVRELARKHGRRFHSLDPEAMARMMEFPWPGNVRQLRQTIERIVVLNEGESVTAAMVPADVVAGGVAGGRAGAVTEPRPTTSSADRGGETIARAVGGDRVSHSGARSASTATEAAVGVSPPPTASPMSGGGIVPLADLERQAIQAAMERCGGSAREAAAALGISLATLYRRLKQT